MGDYEEHLKRVRQEDDPIIHLFCAHCGGVEDVRSVDLHEAVRFICKGCRKKILEWI